MGWNIACLVACGVLVAALSAIPSAFAQMPVATGPLTPLFSPTPVGDRGSVPSFSGYRLSAPIRLSLQGGVLPVAGGFPNCDSLEEDVGNSVGGIPVEHYVELRLTPRLVLSGFTQLGCPIDAGIGGALTYAVPLRESLSLAFGAGLYAAPGQLPLFGHLPFVQGMQNALQRGLLGERSPVDTAARADLVWKNGDGRTLNLGVQSFGRSTQQVMFGGGF